MKKHNVSAALYKKLLSITKRKDSEEEVIRFAVDALSEHFSDYRVTYSNVYRNGQLEVIYTKQPGNMLQLVGLCVDISPVESLVKKFLNLEFVVTNDIVDSPLYKPRVEDFLKISGSRARLDCPLEVEDDFVGLLSLTHLEPTKWSPEIIETIKEVAELIQLMIRDARTRDELHKSEALFRQFAENINAVFWMTDNAKNVMIYVSPAYEEIWGRTRESLYQNPRSFMEAIHRDDIAQVRAAVEKQGEEKYEQIYRIVRPDGTIRWIKDRGFRLSEPDGEVRRVLGIAEDITPLREAIDQLKAAQSQMIAKEKFAAIGELASGLAHEINNPLAVIYGINTQLMEICRQKGEKDAVISDNLSTIEKMSKRIASVVKSLRAFSKKTDQNYRSQADLALICEETLALVRQKLQENGIHLSVNLPQGKTPISCRQSDISQAILHLVNNSIDALRDSESKELEITVDVEGGEAEFCIADYGLGIHEDLREKVFQPFFSTKEVGSGPGLGLSISKAIIENHGGRLEIERLSAPTKICFYLPLMNEEK